MTFLEEMQGIVNPPVKTRCPLSKKTTIGAGGTAKYFAAPSSLWTLRLLIEGAKEHGERYFVLGKGSNVLFGDKGYNGLVISTENINGISCSGETVKVFCGQSLASLINFAKARSLSGMEKLFGIPASVGGAIAMNAGAFGVSVSDYIDTVETIKNGKLVKYYKNECRFGYRKSRFLTSDEVITSATFRFYPQEKDLIEAEIKNAVALRKEIQPAGKTFGSVFKNPANRALAAGEMIEKCGFKGYKIGGASVSEKHANFIINASNASARDILNIIIEIKRKVKDEFNINLKEEIRLVGEF